MSRLRIEGQRQMEIAAPPQVVWDLVADVTRMGCWSPLTVSARWVPPSSGPAVGARFTGTNRLPLVGRWTSTATVTACEPGRIFAFVVGADPDRPNSEWSYRFDDLGPGTLVTETWRMVREPLVVIWYYRLVGQGDRVAAGVEATLGRLKEAAEATHRLDEGTRLKRPAGSPGDPGAP